MLKVRLLIISQPFLYLTAHSCHFPSVVMSTASYLFWFSPLYLCFARLSFCYVTRPPLRWEKGGVGTEGGVAKLKISRAARRSFQKCTTEFHFAQSIKRIFFPFLGLDRRDQRETDTFSVLQSLSLLCLIRPCCLSPVPSDSVRDLEGSP